MNKIKKFNYEYIYLSKLLRPSDNYFSVVINQIYDTLKDLYDGMNTFKEFDKMKKFYPNLINGFSEWLSHFCTNGNREKMKNRVLFNLAKPEDYYFAIVLYISGMTDKFAIDMYNEIIGF